MTPSGPKAFLVSNVNDVELLLMHNRTYAAEYVLSFSCNATLDSTGLEEVLI